MRASAPDDHLACSLLGHHPTSPFLRPPMIRRRTTGVPVNQALYPEPARPDQPKPRPPSAPVQTHVYGQPSFARLPNIYPSGGGVSQGRSFRGEKTLGQTAQLHGRWALRGLKDALRVQRTRDAISR